MAPLHALRAIDRQKPQVHEAPRPRGYHPDLPAFGRPATRDSEPADSSGSLPTA